MARKEKEYQWFGGGQNIEPKTDASTTIAEVIQLIPVVPTTEVVGGRTRFLIEAMYLHFSIHRLLISEIDALGFLVWQSQVTELSTTPTQTLNALSLDDRFYSNKRIMMMAPLPVPPLLASGDLATAIPDERVLVAHHDYQAMRKHDRSNQVLAMIVNCDVSVATSVFCQWRVLVSW